MKLTALPIKGHRCDFQINPTSFLTRSKCECGWVSLWWDRADQAGDEWRDHVGIEE